MPVEQCQQARIRQQRTASWRRRPELGDHAIAASKMSLAMVELVEEGGENIRTQATPLLRAAGVERETTPTSATEVGRFLPPFLFGLGLVEAIPERAILEAEDPDDRDGDGLSGRAGRTPDGRLARFGRKAEFATIQEFVEGALRLEMGLTSRPGDRDLMNGGPLPPGADPVPEPEVDRRTVELLSAFVRFLAAPVRAAPRSRAHQDTVAAGERLFHQAGCATCHTPSLHTGAHEVAGLRRRTVYLYSDLLLHDMGPTLADGIEQGQATGSEFRTAPLWGVGRRGAFLHDGRATSLLDAVLAHAKALGDAFRRRQLGDMTLAVGDPERVTIEAGLARDREAGGRIESSGQQDDGGLVVGHRGFWHT